MDLSEAQREKIEQIFQRRFESFRKGPRNMFRGEFGDEMLGFREQAARMQAEIEAVLTPEQVEKFRELHKDRFFPFYHGIPGEHRRGRWDRRGGRD